MTTMYNLKFKPYQPKPHPRQADITKAQPVSVKSMPGVGNGEERQHGYGRGA